MRRRTAWTLDPHKGIGLPFGTGAILVRDPRNLEAAFGERADYMPDKDAALIDFSGMGIELTREWRGLRVWLPLRVHGAGAFRKHLEERLDWIHVAADGIAAIGGLEIVTGPTLSVLTFRAVAHAGESAAATDARTQAMLAAIHAKGRVYLSGTVLDDRFTIRVCVLGTATTREDIRHLVEDVASAATSVEHA